MQGLHTPILSSSRFPRAGAGFSLLEMVVVLAIIGILVAIQLHNVIGNTDKAKFLVAQTMISDAVTECASAKTAGASERELRADSEKFPELVPSMMNDPEGYKWETCRFRGCSNMRLYRIDSEGSRAVGAGWPLLFVKLAAGGRIVKVAEQCKSFG